ncbi:hypothetical protein Vi05172_g8264 [Venturia inaequalis]|nr:hypothetical protein Vi05172_g8264 [Venturia inaequalis]
MPKAQIPSSDDNATLVDSAGSSTCLGGATLVETEEASKLDRSTDDEENQRQQEEDQHRLENLRITRIPRVLGLLSTIVYAIFARALWIRGSNDQEVDEHVHSALAIGDNPKPSIELFDADLPQEYPSTAHHLSSDTQAQQQSASPSPRVTGSGRVQKRERDENDEDEDEDDQRTDVKRNKKDNDRKLPCPFYRTDPNTFNKDACKKTFKSFSHLCEHLSATNHELHFQPFPKRFVGHFSLEVTPWPSWARAICLRCLANFNNSPDLHSHLESCRSAQPNKHWASDDASLQFGSKWLGVLHTFCSPFDVLQAWEHHRQNLPAKSHKPRVKGKRHAPPRKPTSKVMDEGGTLEFGIQEHVKNSTALESMYTNALTNALTNGALTAQLESAHAKIADLEAEKREVSDAMALFYPSVNIEAVLTQFRAGQSLPSTAPHQQPLASGAMASPASQATPSLKIDSGYGSLIESCAGDGAVGKDLGLGDDLDADGDTVEKEPITRFFDEAIEESECGREIGLPSMNLS